MALLGNQRWRLGRDSYRPPKETINPRRYEVEAIKEDTPAKSFCETHHYSGSYPAARFRYGLYKSEELCGVAVFSHPMNSGSLTNVFGGEAAESVELGRFVLLDHVPGNGETWFLARCFDLLPALRGVVAFSDPLQRTNYRGEAVFPGHLGTIYQAHNAHFVGRATARTLRILPDGGVFSDRTIAKIRAGDTGWVYGIEHLLRQAAKVGVAYAPPPCYLDGEADPDELRRWLADALARFTRRRRHPGNLKYAWSLSALPLAPNPSAYPKR